MLQKFFRFLILCNENQYVPIYVHISLYKMRINSEVEEINRLPYLIFESRYALFAHLIFRRGYTVYRLKC